MRYVDPNNYNATTVSEIITELTADESLMDYLRSNATKGVGDIISQIAEHLIHTDTALALTNEVIGE